MGAVSVHRTPEEEHLAEQERILAELTEQLATRETEFATTGAEFARFRARYLARFAPLYAELDRLEAEIARRVATDLGTAEARAKAAEAEERATDSETAREDAAAQPELTSPPSEDLKALYRRVAKAIHPDLATTTEERERRTRMMAEANAAYAAGDADALERLAASEADRPEAVEGDGTGAQLVRVLRKIAQVRRRFAELDSLEEALEADPMWALYARVSQAEATGADPLAGVEADLLAQIAAAKARLAALMMEARHDKREG